MRGIDIFFFLSIVNWSNLLTRFCNDSRFLELWFIIKSRHNLLIERPLFFNSISIIFVLSKSVNVGMIISKFESILDFKSGKEIFFWMREFSLRINLAPLDLDEL